MKAINQNQLTKLKERAGPVTQEKIVPLEKHEENSNMNIWKSIQSVGTSAKEKLSKFLTLFWAKDKSDEKSGDSKRVLSLEEEHPNIEEMEMAQPISNLKRRKEVTPRHRDRKRA